MEEIVLHGKTWGHSRGVTPLLAVSQRFNELYPHVHINWTKRTLQEFADFSIEKLTETNDLIIIDHPWVGCASATNCVLPLNNYLPKNFLQNQLQNSVGGSHESYNYDGVQWALAIDAATPAASFRKDLLKLNNIEIPQTWKDVLNLAKIGKIAVPAIPIDLLMNFYTFCIANGSTPFSNNHEIINTEIGIAAIETMKQLYQLVDAKMFTFNPIKVAELMSITDEYWYCPFAYCYSNYSRVGFAKNVLDYSDVVTYNNVKLSTTIGGTGIAVSATSKHKEIAIEFAAMVCSPEIQQTMYVQHGGQPAHKAAWLNSDANSLTNNFFKNVLLTMQNGYIRPRYNGYLHFQDNAGIPLQKCLMENGNSKETLLEMNLIYKQSLQHQTPSIIA
jgi:multiple sugar transport system substrate-binding protein